MTMRAAKLTMSSKNGLQRRKRAISESSDAWLNRARLIVLVRFLVK